MAIYKKLSELEKEKNSIKLLEQAIIEYRKNDFKKAEKSSGSTYFLVDENNKIFQTKYLLAIMLMLKENENNFNYDKVHIYADKERIKGGKDRYGAKKIIENIIINSNNKKYNIISKQMLDDIFSQNADEHIVDMEGCPKQVYSTRYERNIKLRKKAIEIHGTTCKACGFNFKDFYGKHGENYIEVHHLLPIANVKSDHDVDPKTDLTVVCSNCHRMIHRTKDKILTIEELKKLVKSTNERQL